MIVLSHANCSFWHENIYRSQPCLYIKYQCLNDVYILNWFTLLKKNQPFNNWTGSTLCNGPHWPDSSRLYRCFPVLPYKMAIVVIIVRLACRGGTSWFYNLFEQHIYYSKFIHKLSVFPQDSLSVARTVTIFLPERMRSFQRKRRHFLSYPYRTLVWNILEDQQYICA